MSQIKESKRAKNNLSSSVREMSELSTQKKSHSGFSAKALDAGDCTNSPQFWQNCWSPVAFKTSVRPADQQRINVPNSSVKDEMKLESSTSKNSHSCVNIDDDH